MTQDDIINMAKQAGFEVDCCSLEWHKRITYFARLVEGAAIDGEKARVKAKQEVNHD